MTLLFHMDRTHWKLLFTQCVTATLEIISYTDYKGRHCHGFIWIGHYSLHKKLLFACEFGVSYGPGSPLYTTGHYVCIAV